MSSYAKITMNWQRKMLSLYGLLLPILAPQWDLLHMKRMVRNFGILFQLLSMHLAIFS